YDVAGDKMNSSKANYFLTVIVSIVIAVGIVISLLSFFVLMLSIYLLLQKNTRKLQDLLLLGYSPNQVARPYMLLVLAINAVVLILAIALMLMARLWYLPMLHAFGVAGASVLPAILVGLLIMALITAGNLLAIRRKVAALWLQ
ncbi:MAG: ABC transporter permease, partial [Muribaculaceae bacterium]|nr:ABC transporter permease [Muribaculaceae bacterium]